MLHDHRRHLLQNPLKNFFLLILKIFLRVLHGAIEGFLLGLDLLLEARAGVLVQLVTLSLKLLLQSFEFVVLRLQFVLFRLQFFA